MADDDIKRMDLAEFRDIGYLQEANRRFFHPLGLALEWREGLTPEQVHDMLRGNEWSPDAYSAAWEVIVDLGLDKPRLSGIWDYRDDPEGMAFAEWSVEKAQNIDAAWEEKRLTREPALGYMIQPIEEDEG